MDEVKRLLEELLAAQVIDIALRLEARTVRGKDALSETYLREALALVRDNRETILDTVRQGGLPVAEPEHLAGSQGNIDAAKKGSLKQKRYDLGKGLY